MRMLVNAEGGMAAEGMHEGWEERGGGKRFGLACAMYGVFRP